MNIAEFYDWAIAHPDEEVIGSDGHRYKHNEYGFRYWSTLDDQWYPTSEFDRTFTIPEPAMIEVDLLTAMNWSEDHDNAAFKDSLNKFGYTCVDGSLITGVGYHVSVNKSLLKAKYLIPEEQVK